MTIQEMRDKKKEKGYTYAQMAELSGVPLGTIQKIFSGETESPRYDTLLALEQIFTEQSVVCEAAASYKTDRNGSYTLDDYYALPEDQRVELIDGYFYTMLSPTFGHQSIAGEIHRQIANYIMEHNGSCRPFIAPVDVQLDCDEKTMVQPDVLVVCDREKIVPTHVYGAPDLIMEILSPATRKIDMNIKHSKYAAAGVREYWLIDPDKKKVVVYDLENEELPVVYGFENRVPVGIFQGECEIDFSEIYESVKFLYQE